VAASCTYLGSITIQVACSSLPWLHSHKFILLSSSISIFRTILQFLFDYVVLFFNSTNCSCCSFVSFSIMHLILHFNRFIFFILCLYSVKCVVLAFLSISTFYSSFLFGILLCKEMKLMFMSLVHHLEGIELH